MKRLRDSQRQRIYDAEEVAFSVTSWLTDPPQWETIEEVRRFVEAIVESPEWRELGGGFAEHIEVRPGRKGQRRGRADPVKGYISLPRRAWRDWYVIHELAHLLAPLHAAWHGPEFCEIYLALLDCFAKRGSTEALEWAFHSGGVRFQPT